MALYPIFRKGAKILYANARKLKLQQYRRMGATVASSTVPGAAGIFWSNAKRRQLAAKAVGAVAGQRRRFKRRRKTAKKGIQRLVRKIVDEGKSIGTYKKVLPEWKYHLSTGSNSENRQGVHEFYFARPLELLDAASVLYNGKTAAADYTVTTNNFGGDPDFKLASASCSYYITNTSQFDLVFDVYSMECNTDSETPIVTRWQAAIDEIKITGSTIPVQEMYVSPRDGSGELSRYWKGVSKKRVVTIKPGQKKWVCSHFLPRFGVNWEDMKYQGNTISYKKGLTKGMLLVQHMPVMYNSDGNKIGVPTTAYGGFVVESLRQFRVVCPDQAAESDNVDRFVYFQNYSTTLGTCVYPAKPTVANIPVLGQ